MQQLTVRYSGLLGLVALVILLSGCAGPRVAYDLLENTDRNNKPLVSSPATVYVEINPDINNYERIDAAVKESLELALKNANVFASNSSEPWKINANVVIASQAAMSFGSFKGKLEIHYVVFDESGQSVFDKVVYTEAGSDKWSLSGAKRHSRSRAVNISKNVLQFVDLLQGQLK